MAIGLKKSSNLPPKASTYSNSSSSSGNDAGDFECNICFELAQDPIVTRCGHLYCWPCLYEWLRVYSHSSECPVCKAVVQEENLVPLYGRGKTQTDPRSKTMPGVNIPNRPSAPRPPTSNADAFTRPLFEFMGGFASPLATMRFGNFALSTGFGGLFASLFGLRLHMFGFPGAAPAFGFEFSNAFHGDARGSVPEPQNQVDHFEEYLKKVFFTTGFLVLFYLFLL